MTGPQAQASAVPGSSRVVIRRPHLEEATRIAAVHVATWKEAYLHLLPEGFFTEGHSRQRREMWAQLLGESRSEWSTWLAESGGEIVGFAMAGPAQEQAAESSARSLYMVYVLRSHHGTGAGQALLDATLGTAPGSDAEPAPGSDAELAPGSDSGPVSLWVAKQNPRAIAFYRRNGFRFDGAEKQDPGAPAITDARMVRP